MASPVDVQTVVAIVTVAASAGAAWAGVRAGLNGMKETVRSISSTLDAHALALSEHVKADNQAQVLVAATSARIEEKCEGICERVDDLREQVRDIAEHQERRRTPR